MSKNINRPMIDVFDVPIRWQDSSGVSWIHTIHRDYDDDERCGLVVTTPWGRVAELEHVKLTDLPSDAIAVMRANGWNGLPS